MYLKCYHTSCCFISTQTIMSGTTFFILQDFWPILRIIQVLGFFPCKKSTDENGRVQLKGIKYWKIISLTSLCFTASALPTFFVIYFCLMKNHSETMHVLVSASLSSTAKETTRMVVLSSNFISSFLSSICIHWKNLTMRNCLHRLQEDFSLLFHGVDFEKSKTKGMKILTVLFFASFLVTFICFYIGMCMPVFESPNVEVRVYLLSELYYKTESYNF